MMSWAVAMAAAAVLAGAGEPARAQARPADFYELTDQLGAWMLCNDDLIIAGYGSGKTAEALVDAAFAACEPHLARAKAVAGRENGPGLDNFPTVIAQRRDAMLKAIASLRSGEDVAGDWGRCVGLRGRAWAIGPETPDAVADRVFAACAKLEQRARAEFTRQAGAERAAALVAEARASGRTNIVTLVDQERRRRAADLGR